MNNPFKRRVTATLAMPGGENGPVPAPMTTAAAALTPTDARNDRTNAAPALATAHTFGRPLHHVRPFMASALHNFTLVAPVLLLTAIGLSVMAVGQATTFISAFTRQAKSEELNRLAPLIDKKPLTPADYQSAANVIAKNNGAVQVGLSRSRTAILLSVKDPAQLPEFIFALATIQSYRQGVAWSAGTICLNRCDGGMAASAELTGYSQAISFSGLRAK